MEALKFLSRIRWISVIVFVLLIVVVGLLIMAVPLRYRTQGDVGLNVKASPSKVKVGEKSKIEVEVKNMNKLKEITVNVEAKTYDEKFLFTQTEEKYASKRDVIIGPKESRKLTFEVTPKSGALPGEYRVDVKAREKAFSEGAEGTVYLKVVKD